MIVRLNWRLVQVMQSLRGLKAQVGGLRGRGSGSTSGTPSGKLPTFTNLLTDDVMLGRNAHMIPVHLPQHPSKDTDTTRKMRAQRDKCWAKHEHLWIKDGLTMGQLPDNVKAEICTELFKPPLRWPWSIAITRTVERMNNVTKKKRNAEKRGPRRSLSMGQSKQGTKRKQSDKVTRGSS